MELKDLNSEILNKQLNKTKRTMQIMTVCLIIMFLGFALVGINSGGDKIATYAVIIFPVSFGIILLDKRYKKIKAELESRK